MNQGLVGRDHELAVIASFFDRSALPGALILEGDAGVGKTALWRAGVECAVDRGFRVLKCSPSDEEARLAFAGLSDLVLPIRDTLPTLPAPQRRALEIALLLRESDGSSPDERAIGAATSGALRAAAEEGPILLACDDVQWLDAASYAALRFAMRRLRGPVALLLVRRTGHEGPSQLLETAVGDADVVHVEVGPLTLGALSRLLRSRASTPLPRSLLSRIHETSGGNAFHALEIVSLLARRGEPVLPGDPLPIPETVQALAGERIASLPAESVAALELAALLAEPSTVLVERAGADPDALRAALGAGVIAFVGDRIHFTHPLLKAATTARMPPRHRRDVHRRLAEAVPTPEERARQLAAGTVAPDEVIAQFLEDTAGDLAARGARWASAELLDDAVRLTPPQADGALPGRLLATANAWYVALDWRRAAARAEQALGVATDAGMHAEALLLVATCLEDPDRVAELAESETDGDDALRARLWTIVADGKLNVDSKGALHAARRALHDAERTGDETLLPPILTLLGVLETMRCEGSPRATLERGVEIERRIGEVDLSLSPSYALGVHAFIRDELDESRALLGRHLDRARTTGDDVAHAHSLWQLAYVEFKAGAWDRAAELADQSYDLYDGSGNVSDTTTALFARALVAACRGERETVDELCRRALALGGQRPRILEQVGLVVGMLELSLERYDEAAAAFRPSVTGWVDPGHQLIAPNRIEALIGAGRLDEAVPLLDDWEALGRRLDRPRALATAWRARGLQRAATGDHGRATEAFERALAQHDRFESPFEQARTMLALGSHRRRVGKRSAARSTLEDAAGIFDTLGATPWLERTRRESARISGRRPSAYDELTDAEERVATLVARGRSNKDVANALYISVKTVEVTLTRVYRKLGVRSRAELALRFTTEAKE